MDEACTTSNERNADAIFYPDGAILEREGYRNGTVDDYSRRFPVDINETAAKSIDAPRKPPATKMVWIPGGMFRMGSEDFYPEEGPIHQVSVGGFWIVAFLLIRSTIPGVLLIMPFVIGATLLFEFRFS